MKDKSKLVPKKVKDKNGKLTTVWVKQGQEPKKDTSSTKKDYNEIKDSKYGKAILDILRSEKDNKAAANKIFEHIDQATNRDTKKTEGVLKLLITKMGVYRQSDMSMKMPNNANWKDDHLPAIVKRGRELLASSPTPPKAKGKSDSKENRGTVKNPIAISKIPNALEEIKAGRATYRGMGMTHPDRKYLKVNGKEYIVDGDEFHELWVKYKIPFKAPFRRER